MQERRPQFRTGRTRHMHLRGGQERGECGFPPPDESGQAAEDETGDPEQRKRRYGSSAFRNKEDNAHPENSHENGPWEKMHEA